jgi:hypothetical protein
LLKIRNGAFEFNHLMQMVEEKMEQIKSVYQTSALPNRPSIKMAEDILVLIRENFYN